MRTERIELEDPYRATFRARVLEVRPAGERRLVVTDRSAFYPEGGGQPADRGVLGGARVVGVHAEGEVVLHEIEGEAPAVGQEVEGEIDFARRFDHMQQHTGQHLLSRLLERELGLRTVSFHLGRRDATIDVVGGEVEENALRDIEDLARGIVRAALPVRWTTVPRQEAAALGLRGETGGRERVRVVSIGDVDRSACGGTHVRRTSEIEAVRIVGLERVRRAIRIHFLCGGRVHMDHRARIDREAKLRRLLGVPEEETVERVDALLRRASEQDSRIRRLEAALIEAEAERLATGARGPVAALCESPPAALLRRLAARVGDRTLLVRRLGETAEVAFFDPDGRAGEHLATWAARLGGKAGGRGTFAQGRIPSREVERLLEEAGLPRHGFSDEGTAS